MGNLMNAGDRLTRALIDLAAGGGSVPCGEYGNHELWTSDHVDDRVRAVARCHGCAVLSACHDAADEAGEQWHVWGGVDRTKMPSRKRKAA